MTVAKSLPHLWQKVRKLLIPKLFLSYSCIFGKKASANGAIAAAIGTFVFSLLMLYLFPEISFINRMGYVFLLCALIIVIFGLVCPNTKLANTIELNAKLFRTTTLFKILSILILAILCVIYYIFW